VAPGAILWGVDDLRMACAAVAQRASWVRVQEDAVVAYATSLSLDNPPGSDDDDDDAVKLTDREDRAAYWLQLDAINFGSGWFPTLRKHGGRSGYQTIARELRICAEMRGPFTAVELERIDAGQVAEVIDQDPDHPLIELFARSLRDLGSRVLHDGGSFADVADAAAGSAVALTRGLGAWDCFADCSRYQELELPFLKRAQIAAADLQRAGVVAFADYAQLTMFADNLVPHVLRLDGVLRFDPELVARIERGELIEHDSPEEIEIRACALHAVELLVGARGGTCAADVDQVLWHRGGQPRYKAVPRHRTRCTAY
jgi:hypothetical protein